MKLLLLKTKQRMKTVYSLSFYLWLGGALPLRVADNVVTGDSHLGAAVRVGLQSPVRTEVLVVAAPAGVHHTESVHLVCHGAAHVREVSPAVAPGVASLHVYGVRAVGVVLSHASDTVSTETPATTHQHRAEE